MSISKILDISRRSLYVYQRALDITANNIANVNNKNYTKQQIVFGTVAPDKSDKFSVGDGVTIADVQRQKNQFTETQIRNYSQNQSYDEKKANLLGNLETILSEPSELGLSNQLNLFFNSWQELSVNPLSTELRANVIQTAQNFSDKLQKVYDGFSSLRGNLKEEAVDSVNLINKYTEEIKTLNEEIFRADIKGLSSSDLLDRRDELIIELSKMANINVSIDKDNMASISIGGAYAVDRYHSIKFKAVENENGSLSIQSEDGQRTLQINKGSLGALVELSGKTIPGYLKVLDSIGNSIMSAVNSAHTKGYTNTQPPLNGINFFESYDSGQLKINKNILDDLNYIATSADGTGGNNDIAKQIAALKDANVVDGMKLSEKYSNFVGELANSINGSAHNTDSYNLVLDQLEQQKSSYSGVSTDEEMVNILRYQKSYEAAAKLIKIADDLFQTLLNTV
ncbi:MAG: flagellar hook-associated protein FlgK [Ignavibacteriales bacterium]|nr:flagellar hook-associated protein FlgK [Ignavibacteriales bacterium]